MDYIKWAFENMENKKWQLWLGVLFNGLLSVPAVLVGPLIIARLIDSIFTQHDLSGVPMLIGSYIGITVIRIISYYIGMVLLDKSSQHTVKVMRDKLYEKLQKLSQSFYNSTRTGAIMMRMTGDLESIRHFLCWIIPHTVNTLVILIFGMVIFLFTSPLLTLVLLLFSPIIAVLAIRMRKVVGPAHSNVRTQITGLNTVVQENIAGNRVVKAFVREDYEVEKFEEKNKAFSDASIYAARIWAVYGPIIEAVSNILSVVSLLIGGIFVIKGTMTFGQLSIFLSLNWVISDAMRMSGVLVNDTQRFFASAEKVMPLYYARVEIKNCKKPYIPENPKGEIVFENVSFKYHKTPVLKDISFAIKPGETVGIMGPTGAGKSTIISLLARFYEKNSGSIKIDGVDVEKYDLKALRSIISSAMQDVFLFSNTIDANIAYGSYNADENEIVKCAKMADAHDFIEKLPHKYQTIIGERGVGLSGGQKQRISLARALAYKAPILVLDDVTSAVDMETEKYIQKELKGAAMGLTTIIVAQRISSVKNADKILVIEDGRITEVGTHKELLAKKGYYYNICRIQYADADKESAGVLGGAN